MYNMATTFEVQKLQVDSGILFPNQIDAQVAMPPILGQVLSSNTDGNCSPLAMYVLKLDTDNYFGQSSPPGATEDFPPNPSDFGNIEIAVWFPNLVGSVTQIVVLYSTDVGQTDALPNPVVSICSAGNSSTVLRWYASKPIDNLMVMFYTPSSPFLPYTP